MKKIIMLCSFSLLAGFFVIAIAGTGYSASPDVQLEQRMSDRSGVIDGIAPGERIIINDCSFRLSAETQYNRPGNLNCSGRWFKKNDRIYYTLEPGTRNVKTIWLAGGKYKGIEKP